MVTRVKVEQKVLNWAIMQSGKDDIDINKKFPKYEEWLTGETEPTLNQLLDFSTFTKIPFGYLVLKQIPIETLPLLEFRTIDTEEVYDPSRELIDTIKDMENKQEWMREYLEIEGYSRNNLVGSIKFTREFNATEVSAQIKRKIGLNDNWFENTGSKDGSFRYLKNCISNSGILVMQNGTALGNSHRPLNVNEFRAFALVDDFAPLIFINTKDTLSGKVFSILHELAHIFLGIDSLYNDNFFKRNKLTNDLEIFCNSVAAEIAVPSALFLTKWRDTPIDELDQKISRIADIFKISNVVIARKALDNKLITHEVYNRISDEARVHSNRVVSSTSGGNAIYTEQSRLDNKFIYALSTSLDRGYAVYSDIYKLTGLSKNVFDKVEKNIMGGM